MTDRQNVVLLVESDAAVRDALEFALQLEGLHVRVHTSGAALLRDPDLAVALCVILSEHMAHIDGFALIDILRTKNINIPTILLTSHATALLRERADHAGVTNVLEKPLMDNTLVDSIRRISAGTPAENT
jgi:two-component system, LuxR family, response regulator FixJ